MKFLSVIALATLAAASPMELVARKTGTTEREYTEGGCRDVIFFWARGSTETGNMGASLGPPVSDKLKDHYGDARVATQGIDYRAALGTNTIPGGCDPREAALMTNLVNDAAAKCPDSRIVVGGYSQGAAIVHRAVEKLSQAVMDKVDAAVTFGDTQNKQDGGRIPNFPPEKTKIICNSGDAVCKGSLTVLPAHLAYYGRIQEGADFIFSKTKA